MAAGAMMADLELACDPTLDERGYLWFDRHAQARAATARRGLTANRYASASGRGHCGRGRAAPVGGRIRSRTARSGGQSGRPRRVTA